MLNKNIRILIIDPVHAQVYSIEKMLNVMGYFCVATTANVEEGLLLSRFGVKHFDVLITSLPVLVNEHCQVNCFDGFNIRNLFLYSCSRRDSDIPIWVKGEARFKSGMPEYEVLQEFMAMLPRPMFTPSVPLGAEIELLGERSPDDVIERTR